MSGQILCESVFTRGQSWPPVIVVASVSLCVCVRPGVYQSRACQCDNSSLFQARSQNAPNEEKFNFRVKFDIEVQC